MYIYYFMLQNIFHAVVEIPRWTNAKMEVMSPNINIDQQITFWLIS